MSKETKAAAISAGVVVAIFVIAIIQQLHFIAIAAVASCLIGCGFGVWIVLRDYQVKQHEDEGDSWVRLGMFGLLLVVLFGIGCFAGGANGGVLWKVSSVAVNWISFIIGAVVSSEKEQEIVGLFYFRVLSH
ncbi:MAG: hypothetical protein HY918_03745 [Candidatus Doudnabacteria bacterium]|nr:hypothetical protein [Candidatus Doudnabacteria bacterium]